MSDPIDKRIAELEKELAGLRRQKLTALQSEVAALEASLGSAASGGAVPAGVGRRRKGGRPPKAGKGWAAALQSDSSALAGGKRKRRGRKRGKHIPDADALAMLTKVVAAAGKTGISARQASQEAGIFYPRTIALMSNKFKKTGLGKWTRYTLK